MHQPWWVRLPGKAVVLGHGQCIHVGPQPDHRPLKPPLAPDHRHQPGFADVGVNLVDTTHRKRLLDPRRRVDAPQSPIPDVHAGHAARR
jgi:hypothetical protein